MSSNYNKELIEEALRQALANILLEADINCNYKEAVLESEKILKMGGKKDNGNMGRLFDTKHFGTKE